MRRMRRSVMLAAAGVVVVAALVVAAALGAFRSDADRVVEAVSQLMESYVVPDTDEDDGQAQDVAWPADDYGDAETMEVLERYGVSADEWRRHCLANLEYEVGEASVTEDRATVGLTMTNASLSAAVEAAGADFATYVESDEAGEAYASGGRAALFSHLVELVYAHLDANESPVTTTLELEVLRDEDGTWVPQVSGNEEFFSGLYGGSDVVSGLASATE